jgi:Tfp pilus assembly protein PilV
MNRIPHQLTSRQRGLSLLEALIALLVLSLGLLAVARLQPQLRQHAELSRQRSEALRLAQEDVERLRSFSVLGAATGSRSFADIGAAQRSVDADSGLLTNSRYRVTRDIAATATPNAKEVSVTVDWLDRGGATQQVTLASMIAAGDPVLAGVLSLSPRGVQVRGTQARSIQIPLEARDLGDGRSVFKPITGGMGAIVFDNRSGAVTEHCTGLAAASTTQSLVSSDLSQCTHVNGMLLRGEIRFSAAMPPVADAANDTPLPLEVSLVLDGGTPLIAPWCETQALKTVATTRAGSQRFDAVPLAATPASMGLTEWNERGERFVGYHCVVIPPVGIARWSGRTSVVPSGWSIGTGPDDWRVCRYSADLDGSGAIDANIEHPPIYQNVVGALARQNFLVVKGHQACPGSTGPIDARLATAPHQP